MKLCFDSIDEVKDFVKQLKGTRGGKAGDADEGTAGQQIAPQPLQPPAGGAGGFPGAAGFAPPGAGVAQQAGAFPVHAAPTAPPEVLEVLARIVAKIDGAIASGQPADGVLQWFRGQCGPEAANFDLNQIKMVALPKMAMPQLDNIAKLMAA